MEDFGDQPLKEFVAQTSSKSLDRKKKCKHWREGWAKPSCVLIMALSPSPGASSCPQGNQLGLCDEHLEGKPGKIHSSVCFKIEQ